MNKKTFFRILEILIFVTLTLYLLIHLSYSLRDNLYRTGLNMKGYYGEEENTLDLVILGTSSTFSAIAPMELWNSYGIASYDFCTNVQFENSMPFSIRELSKTQNPKLVMIDLAPFMMKHNSVVYQEVDCNMRYNTDGFSYSKNRFDLINALVPDPEDRIYYYFDILYYHTNEPSLSSWNWELQNARKGYANLNGNAVFTEEQWMEDIPENFEMPEDEVHYLDLLLEELEKHDFEVLFFNGPYFQYEEKLEQAKRVQWVKNYLTEKGYSYLDMNDYRKQIGFDSGTDYSMDYCHYHINSALKITEFLGEYLTENYSLPDHRSDVAYDLWKEQSLEWAEYKANCQQKRQEALENGQEWEEE